MSELWCEKYRPKSLSEVKGQKRIVERVKAMVNNKNLNNLLLAGPPGVGKTSMILAVARELYGENWRQNILETNASMDRGINVVRDDIKNFARTKAIGDAPFKICILDEADALTKDAQNALRRTMELFSGTCRFCLIANYSSKIIEPIQSRCTIFRFKPLNEDEIKDIIDKVAKNEQLNVSEGAIEALIEASNGDVRRMENVLQSCAAISPMINDELVYNLISVAKPQEVKETLKRAVDGDFSGAREKLLEIMLKHGLSGLDIIRQIQRAIWSLYIDDNKKLAMIEKCGEIEFRMVEGADEFIQLESLLASFTKR